MRWLTDDNPRDLSRRRAMLVLLALTCLAAALRFRVLDRPPVWGDEAMVFVRTCGTYEELKEWLVEDGFTPMHYQAVWWMTQGCPVPYPTAIWTSMPIWSPGGSEPWYDVSLPRPIIDTWTPIEDGVQLTPFMLRLPSATAGVVMVPAMYLLAVQLARRRTALVVALLTCCSAYLLTYSRDAKMYAVAWMFIPLHVGLLLAWLRRRRERRWATPALLGWILCGVGMVSWHASTAVVLGVSLLIGVTYQVPDVFKQQWHLRRHRLPTAVPLLLGLGVIGLCLAGYYGVGEPDDAYYVGGFNRWAPLQTGDRPIQEWDIHRGGIGWVSYQNTGRDLWDHLRYTATAFGFSWEWPRPRDVEHIPSRTLTLLQTASWTLAAIFFLVVPTLAISPWPKRRPTTGLDGGRAWWWLLTWICLPLGVWWMLSRDDPVLRLGNENWGETPWLALAMMVPPVAAVLLHRFMVRTTRAYVWSLLHRTWPIVGAAVLAGAAMLVVEGESAGKTIWMPRYLGFIVPAVLVLAGAALASIPRPYLRGPIVAIVVGINLANAFARTHYETEPPADRFAKDVAAAKLDPAVAAFVQPVNRQANQNMTGVGAPGGGYLYSIPSLYYGLLATGLDDDPTIASPRYLNYRNRLPFGRLYGEHLINERSDDARIASSLSTLIENGAADDWRTIILWTTGDRDAGVILPALQDLDPAWTLVSDELVPVREHWTWQELAPMRRRAYRRENSAAVSGELKPPADD